MILLSVFCVLLFICLVFSVILNVRAGATILAYEKFYEDTITDFDEAIKFTNSLKKREMIADDNDFKRLRDLIVTLHDTMVNYVNARERLKPVSAGSATGQAKEEVGKLL